jgi:hypothetical protein
MPLHEMKGFGIARQRLRVRFWVSIALGHVMTARPNVLIPVAMLSVMAVLPSGRATAGPPFLTDDPEPVPYQHFEFYNLSLGTTIRGDTAGEGPAWEYNYGLIPNGQIHIIVPLTFDAPAGGPIA